MKVWMKFLATRLSFKDHQLSFKDYTFKVFERCQNIGATHRSVHREVGATPRSNFAAFLRDSSTTR